MLVPVLALLPRAGRGWETMPARSPTRARPAELAAHLGYAADGSVAVGDAGLATRAARGLHDEARESLVRARMLTDRAGNHERAPPTRPLTSAFCALCRGDLARSSRCSSSASPSTGAWGEAVSPSVSRRCWSRRTPVLGGGTSARSLTARYAEATAAAAPPLSIALLRRCQAITADSEVGAQEAFDAAMQAHAAASDPFEAARTRLLYGGRLRRAGQRVAARLELGAARDAF